MRRYTISFLIISASFILLLCSSCSSIESAEASIVSDESNTAQENHIPADPDALIPQDKPISEKAPEKPTPEIPEISDADYVFNNEEEYIMQEDLIILPEPELAGMVTLDPLSGSGMEVPYDQAERKSETGKNSKNPLPDRGYKSGKPPVQLAESLIQDSGSVIAETQPGTTEIPRERERSGLSSVQSAATSVPVPPASSAARTAEAGNGPPREIAQADIPSVISPERPQPLFKEFILPLTKEPLKLVFPGLGWIYLGQEEGDAAVSYISRNFEGNDTVFNFSASKEGRAILKFQNQDAERGFSVQHRVSLTINPETEETIPGTVSVIIKGDYSLGDRLKAEGKNLEALYAYIEAFKEGDSLGMEKIASLASILGEHSLSAEYWRKLYNNSDIRNTRRESALNYIQEVVRGDLMPALPPSEIIRYTGKEDTALLLGYAQRLEKNKDIPGAIQIYEHLALLGDSFSEPDKLYFLLGMLYESDSPVRNEKKALEYYDILINNYPISLYWQKAKERALYISRHYFHIR